MIWSSINLSNFLFPPPVYCLSCFCTFLASFNILFSSSNSLSSFTISSLCLCSVLLWESSINLLTQLGIGSSIKSCFFCHYIQQSSDYNCLNFHLPWYSISQIHLCHWNISSWFNGPSARLWPKSTLSWQSLSSNPLIVLARAQIVPRLRATISQLIAAFWLRKNL